MTSSAAPTMKTLLQPITEAFEILVRDNPGRQFQLVKDASGAPSGIWMRTPADRWAALVFTHLCGTILVVEPGEKACSMSDQAFWDYMANRSNPRVLNAVAEFKQELAIASES